MGSLPRPRLTNEQIIAQYEAGESQALLGLRARLSTAKVRDILIAHGVRLRTQQETLRLTLRTRKWTPPRKRG